MFGWQKKKRRWKAKWNPVWYSTGELEEFRESVLELVNKRARPVHEHLAQVARIENELERRHSSITKENV
jgi:hypothetical protein